MSKNIFFEGWLTKSPPTKRIWRAKWRRRWFALRHSGDLPGQYFLDYYADRTRRRPKGTIDLDLCEQVDAGLHMERGNTLDPRLRGSVFTVRTHHRTYHLEADSEADMAKWVEAICRACGLRSTEDANEGIATYQNSPPPVCQELVDSNGLYIPISECITGVRVQDQRAFTFDPKSIMERHARDAGRHSASQPHMRVATESSENDDDGSDDDCKSLSAGHSNVEEGWSVAQSFTKLSLDSKGNEGPPVPPRPPKPFQGPRMMEPDESDYISVHTGPVSQGAVPKRPSRPHRARSPTSPAKSDHEEDHTVYISQGAIPKRPSHPTTTHHALTDNITSEPDADPRKKSDEERDILPALCQVKKYSPPPPRFTFDERLIASLQYCNLSDEVASSMAVASSLASGGQPPAVDRKLKPRVHTATNTIIHQPLTKPPEVRKSDVLQYLDLDLPVRTPQHRSCGKNRAGERHSKESDANYNYKTVDFLKTEAFNMTRQDAEAFRNIQC